MFEKANAIRGEYPIGVSVKNKLFLSSCSVYKDGKSTKKHIGVFNTPEEAFYKYKEFKENYIKEVAEEYKDVIPVKLYEAMYRYKVEIDD